MSNVPPAQSAPFTLLKPSERHHFTQQDQVDWRKATLQIEQAQYPMHSLVRIHGHTVIALERCMAYWRNRALDAEKEIVAITSHNGTDIAA